MHYSRTVTQHLASILLPLLLFVIAGMSAAHAQTTESFPATHFTILDGDNEVPPTTNAGQGIAIMRYDPSSTSLEYRVTVFLPGDTISAAHFHTGAEGMTGPPVHTINFPAGRQTATGTWSNISTEHLQLLAAGNVYVNVHTTRNPAGQVRGQVAPIPNFAADLTPGAEVPPVTTSMGTATLAAWLDPVARRLVYHLEWDSLTGPPTMGHFHRGVMGQTGPPIHTFPLPSNAGVKGELDGIWENLTETDISDLRSGGLYANLHTQQHQPGEIRGQVYTSEFFTAAVSPANEAPPVTGSDMEGTGFTLLSNNSVFGLFLVNGGTGPIAQAHIHRGAVGVSGPVAYPLVGIGPIWGIPTGVPVTAEDQNLFRTGGMYANFHTQQNQLGEARGQLIASPNNIPPLPTSSSVPFLSPTGEKTLAAWYDGTAGMIRYDLAGARTGGNAQVALYSSLGEKIVMTGVEGDQGTLAVGTIPAGVYFLQLVVDGVPAGFGRIAVVR